MIDEESDGKRLVENRNDNDALVISDVLSDWLVPPPHQSLSHRLSLFRILFSLCQCFHVFLFVKDVLASVVYWQTTDSLKQLIMYKKVIDGFKNFLIVL